MRRLVLLLSVLLALAVFVPSVVVAQEADSDAAGLARTDVHYLIPYGPDGLNPGLTVAGNVSGTCFAESLAVPERPDAFECIDDTNQIFDPCFEQPFTTDEDTSVELACVTDPFSNEVTLFAVDGPLPREKDAPSEQSLFPPWALPWAVELANGDRCVLLHGAGIALAGEAVYYGCENGGFILGEVDLSQPMWTVNYLAEGAVASGLVEVTAAWS